MIKIRKITIHKKGFWRKAYNYIRRGKKIHVKKTHVKPTTYKAKDRGVKGKGKKVIKGLRTGAMTNLAVKEGYIKENERVSDIPNTKIPEFAYSLVDRYGYSRAMKMVQAQITLRKRQHNKGFKKKMLIAKDAIQKGKGLSKRKKEKIEFSRKTKHIVR